MPGQIDTTYNGWSNYETWNVALWLDNEPSTYTETREAMREAWNDHDMADPVTRDRTFFPTQSAAARYQFSMWLEEYVKDMQPDLGASVWSDLLGAALSEVNWYEIADNWLSELDGYESKDHHVRPSAAQ